MEEDLKVKATELGKEFEDIEEVFCYTSDK